MRHLYLTHPQVIRSPDVAVPDWPLAPEGRARIATLAVSPNFPEFDLIAASSERKAQDAADILAAVKGWPLVTRTDLGENDRSTTGYLPPAEFEVAADAFFGAPDRSYLGWETAEAAQRRIVAAVEGVTQEWPGRRVIFIGHGAVGTLLWCHLSGRQIDRQHDQPGGTGGCWFTFESELGPVQQGWQPLEALL